MHKVVPATILVVAQSPARARMWIQNHGSNCWKDLIMACWHTRFVVALCVPDPSGQSHVLCASCIRLILCILALIWLRGCELRVETRRRRGRANRFVQWDALCRYCCSRFAGCCPARRESHFIRLQRLLKLKLKRDSDSDK